MVKDSRPVPLGQAGGSIAHLREHNLSQILTNLLLHGPQSRAVLASHLGLGVSALTKLIAQLRQRGLVSEAADPDTPARGRPTNLIVMDRSRWAVAGLMLDRRNIEVVVGRLDGEVLLSRNFPLPATENIEQYLPHLTVALHEIVAVCQAHGLVLLSVELGIAGAADRQHGQVVRSMVNNWGSYPLREEVERILAEIPAGVAPGVLVGLDRETNYAMVARIAEGPGLAGSSSIAYLGGRYAASGGLATGLDINHGSSGLAGEIGHVVVDPTGTQCWCGRRGCVETRLGLSSLCARITGAEPTALAELAARREALVGDLLRACREGQSSALLQMEQAGFWLAVTIDTVAAVVNPQQFIVDGYLAAFGPYVQPAMNRHLMALGTLPSLVALEVRFTEGDVSVVQRGLLRVAVQSVAQYPAVAAQ